MTASFDAFIRSLRPQTPFRTAITTACRRPWPEFVPLLRGGVNIAMRLMGEQFVAAR